MLLRKNRAIYSYSGSYNVYICLVTPSFIFYGLMHIRAIGSVSGCGVVESLVVTNASIWPDP